MAKKHAYEWDGIPFDKTHEEVKSRSYEAHAKFANEIEKRMEAQGIKRPDIALRIGGEAPQVYRVLDPRNNVTIDSMCRVAAAVGARVEISVKDAATE